MTITDYTVITVDAKLEPIVEALQELTHDGSVPKNVRSKIDTIISTLKQDSDISMSIDKALQELDEISDDTNLQPFTRTQVWNIASMLETL